MRLTGRGLVVALDAGGGPTSASGWTAAFALLAVGIVLRPVALWWSRDAGAAGNASKST